MGSHGLLALLGEGRGLQSAISLGGYADSTALRCAGGRAVEQVEDDLLVAVLIQVEADLLGTALAGLGNADRQLLGAVAPVADADIDLLTRCDVAEIQDDRPSS